MQICKCAVKQCTELQICKPVNNKVTTYKSICKFADFLIGLFSGTGTRIRTKIKGFGDPYATVAPFPYFAHKTSKIEI